jgi:hypothetical protein
MAEAIGGDFVQQLRQLLAEPREPVLRVERARAVRLAFLFIGVDQVDVGTEIQFAAAQLAQPEHHQPLRTPAIGRAHHAEALHHLGFQRVQRSCRQPSARAVLPARISVDRRVLRSRRATPSGSIPPAGARRSRRPHSLRDCRHRAREARAARGGVRLQSRQQRRLARPGSWMAKSLAIASLPIVASSPTSIAQPAARRRAQARAASRLQVVGVIQ